MDAVAEDAWFVCIVAEPRGSQGTQTRGTWDGCITEGCSSIKNQTIYIGSVKAITGAFFLEGVQYIRLTSHVPISVSTRMTLAWHQKWLGRSGPCLVYRRDGYRFAIVVHQIRIMQMCCLYGVEDGPWWCQGDFSRTNWAGKASSPGRTAASALEACRHCCWIQMIYFFWRQVWQKLNAEHSKSAQVHVTCV